MIIDDLEHLKFISENNEFESACILGSAGITIAPPVINLVALVKAYSFPTGVDLGFLGNVNASEFSLLKVFSNVYVRAISPL